MKKVIRLSFTSFLLWILAAELLLLGAVLTVRFRYDQYHQSTYHHLLMPSKWKYWSNQGQNPGTLSHYSCEFYGFGDHKEISFEKNGPYRAICFYRALPRNPWVIGFQYKPDGSKELYFKKGN